MHELRRFKRLEVINIVPEHVEEDDFHQILAIEEQCDLGKGCYQLNLLFQLEVVRVELYISE